MCPKASTADDGVGRKRSVFLETWKKMVMMGQWAVGKGNPPKRVSEVEKE
jgi:hypothetical protein